jgi:hypothetical protein
VVDNPGGFLGGKNKAYLTVHELDWKGPYIESLNKRGPWGRNYWVYVKAMWNPTAGTDKEYGWVISAGPDGKLDTLTTSNQLGGDDIGIIICAAEKGR